MLQEYQQVQDRYLDKGNVIYPEQNRLFKKKPVQSNSSVDITVTPKDPRFSLYPFLGLQNQKSSCRSRELKPPSTHWALVERVWVDIMQNVFCLIDRASHFSQCSQLLISQGCTDSLICTGQNSLLHLFQKNVVWWFKGKKRFGFQVGKSRVVGQCCLLKTRRDAGFFLKILEGVKWSGQL